MKTVVIGDLHLSNWYPGYLDAQIDCIKNILKKELPCDVIFLGDLFHNRRPSAPVLLALKELLIGYRGHPPIEFTIIMGNHDAHSKADDGVTSLSLLKNKNIKIITRPTDVEEKTFIPHYEDEETIKRALRCVPDGNLVFGHFSYSGLVNARNDYDFTIDRSEFTNDTYLGHVHRFSRDEKIRVVGTPYSTQFSESGKKNYYCILENGEEKFKEVQGGLRHLVLPYEKLEEFKLLINDPHYYTLLRVELDLTKHSNDRKILEEVKTSYHADYIETRFLPVIPKDKKVSDFVPDSDLFTLNDAIFEEYIDKSQTKLSKEDLWSGLELLKK